MTDIDFEHAAEALAGRYEERDKISAMLACLCSAVTSAREALVDAMSRNTEALERVADAADAYRLSRHEGLTVGELMEGVNFDSEPKTEELNAEGAKCTSYVRLAIEDFGFGLEVRAYDDVPVEAYGDATAEWSFRSPEDVRALASAFRTKYATLLDMAAERWERGLRNGSIQTGEAAA